MRGHIRVRDGKRGTTYQVVVFLGVDGAGKRRYVRETVQGSRRDAEARLAELIVAVNTGARGAPTRYRFCDLVDAWWETSTAHLSPWTRIG